MLCDLGGNVGLGSVIATLAPHDPTDMRGERLAEGQRLGLAFVRV
jgi:hypothetical protein